MSTLASPVRPVKAPRKIHVATRPATGSCRWAVQPGTGPNAHPGCLVVTTEDGRTHKPVSVAYLVSPITDRMGVVGYTLKKTDGTAYDLPADLSACDCGDHTFHPERPGGCKHMRALAAALRSLGVEAAAAA